MQIQKNVINLMEIYNMNKKKLPVVEITKRFGGYCLSISQNGWQYTSIGCLSIRDIKKIRKTINNFLKEHENNQSL